jgi:hypothetical protein
MAVTAKKRIRIPGAVFPDTPTRQAEVEKEREMLDRALELGLEEPVLERNGGIAFVGTVTAPNTSALEQVATDIGLSLGREFLHSTALPGVTDGS